jgi:hypothetical protein
MKKEDDVSTIAVKKIRCKWFHDIKVYIKILYYKMILK